MARADEELDRIRGEYGVDIDDDNADKLRRLEGEASENENFESYLRDIEEKQKLRARPTFSAGGIGGDDDRDGDGVYDGARRGSGGNNVLDSWGGDGGGGGERARDPRIDALYARLLADSEQTFDRNDPIIRAQADTFAANKTREMRNYLGDVAERSGPHANLRGEERMASERLGQATGTFEAGLMAREREAHRAQITQRLAAMQGLLSFEEENALRMQLAQMDAEIRREGMGTQNDQFMRDLALREWDRANYWDYTRTYGY